MSKISKNVLQPLSPGVWELPRREGMWVPGRIYASAEMLETITHDNALQQVRNVATLPGIINAAIAMPDIHWGYGFPIGGVAAFSMEEGIISPGGVGYDINCGVRLLTSRLQLDDVRPHLKELLKTLYQQIPAGVGGSGKLLLKEPELKKVLREGAAWAVRQGYGTESDLERIEERGCMENADPEALSERALGRGRPQLGTLGSGNHFVEVGYVAQLFDQAVAERLGLKKGTITVTIHTGSRGLGHQVCDDAIRDMLRASEKYHIKLPDRQLCCAPIRSPEGQEYLTAMNCAVNFGFANRQLLTHQVREAFRQGLRLTRQDAALNTVYEVAHNIAKIEQHLVDGKQREVCVHRKGATRAFGPGHSALPASIRDLGQPVLIPGDMGRYSWVMVGTEQAMLSTFGSACHGAGRMMSRRQALKHARGRSIIDELADKGIAIMARNKSTIAEEMPEAYKDVAQVVSAIEESGIARSVARLRPLAVLKG
jgi:tRNA-splicing ligase RtcB (3'-phosphate/5'-hydroxy nucleic acid ligase)